MLLRLSPLVALASVAIALGGDDPPPRGDDPPVVAVRSSIRAKDELIAIGDIHADYARFFRLLRDLELVDSDGDWAGGDTTLVQTGDILDRGLESRRTVELLMRLEKAAAKAGGRVIVLLGNHEVWNLAGDYTYVAPAELELFAADESAELRAKRRREIEDAIAGARQAARSDFPARLARSIATAGFDRYFPRGWFAYVDTYSTRSEHGRWLLGKGFLHAERGYLFVHAGIAPRDAQTPAAKLDKTLRDALASWVASVEKLERLGVWDRAFGMTPLLEWIRSESLAGGPVPGLAPLFREIETIYRGPLFAADSLVMYRGLALEDETRFAPAMREILAAQRVEHIVVGHTQPADFRIASRFGGALLMIDTGLNESAFGGTPSALIVDKDRRWAPYP